MVIVNDIKKPPGVHGVYKRDDNTYKEKLNICIKPQISHGTNQAIQDFLRKNKRTQPIFLESVHVFSNISVISIASVKKNFY